MHKCKNKLVRSKILLPLAQKSHQATVALFSLPLLQQGSSHLGQPLVFKPCCALAIPQPTSSVGQCGSGTGSHSCFTYTEQICCSLQWEVLRNTRLLTLRNYWLLSLCSEPCPRPPTQPWLDLVGVGWGCTFQPHTQLLDLSGNSTGYRGNTVAGLPQLAPRAFQQQEKPPQVLIQYFHSD